jgi:single-strand DNA-binding protein
MVNRVVLIGRLTRDPEVRTTTTGSKVAEFSIAVDKRNRDEGANFFRIKAWGNQADYVANYLNKGRLVAIDGRLDWRKWQDKEGQNRETIEIVAESVQGLDRPRDDQGGGAPLGGGGGGYSAPNTGGAAPAADEYDPFADE